MGAGPFTDIPQTAFDPAQPGAAFSPADFYRAYINAMQTGASESAGGKAIADPAVIGPTGMELFNSNAGLPPGTFFTGSAFGGGPSASEELANMVLGGAGSSWWEETPGQPNSLKQLDPSSMLTHLETEQLASFEGSKPISAWGTFEEMLPHLAEIGAMLAGGAAGGSGVAALLSTVGTVAGDRIAGPTGAAIGGLVGGGAGGIASGAAGLSGAATGAGAGAGDVATSDLGGLSGAGTATTATGQALAGGGLAGVGNAGAGVNPGGGSSGAPAGGSAPGTSLGTDPSTAQALTGGATGGAQTPGSAVLGTGADASAPGLSSTAKNVLSGFNDLTSAARFAQSLDALTSGTQAGPAAAPQALPADQTQPQASVPISGAGAAPVSQIAASAVPSGEFQSITQDYATQTENSIRAQFANQGISGSPMEERQLQGVRAAATQRASAAEQAMQQAGITDPNVFAALMVSNLDPSQFASSLAQTGIR